MVINYIITNEGDQPLVIDDATASCHCTTAKYDPAAIAPGKSTTVMVVFQTKSAYGRQDRVVEVFSNDPRSPLKLRFKGVVDQP